MPQAQDQITITGYEKNAEAARDAIMKIVGELEQMVSEDVTLDHRVHARIIGARGKAIRKIMDEFKVSGGGSTGWGSSWVLGSEFRSVRFTSCGPCFLCLLSTSSWNRSKEKPMLFCSPQSVIANVGAKSPFSGFLPDGVSDSHLKGEVVESLMLGSCGRELYPDPFSMSSAQRRSCGFLCLSQW